MLILLSIQFHLLSCWVIFHAISYQIFLLCSSISSRVMLKEHPLACTLWTCVFPWSIYSEWDAWVIAFTLLGLTNCANILYRIAAPFTLLSAGQGCPCVPLSQPTLVSSKLPSHCKFNWCKGSHIIVLIYMPLITNNSEQLVICVIAF